MHKSDLTENLDKSKKKGHPSTGHTIDPVDATVSAHFPDWKKPLQKFQPGPQHKYSIITSNPKAGRSSFITTANKSKKTENVKFASEISGMGNVSGDEHEKKVATFSQKTSTEQHYHHHHNSDHHHDHHIEEKLEPDMKSVGTQEGAQASNQHHHSNLSSRKRHSYNSDRDDSLKSSSGKGVAESHPHHHDTDTQAHHHDDTQAEQASVPGSHHQRPTDGSVHATHQHTTHHNHGHTSPDSQREDAPRHNMDTLGTHNNNTHEPVTGTSHKSSNATGTNLKSSVIGTNKSNATGTNKNNVTGTNLKPNVSTNANTTTFISQSPSTQRTKQSSVVVGHKVSGIASKTVPAPVSNGPSGFLGHEGLFSNSDVDQKPIVSGENLQIDFNKGAASARTLFKMDPRRDQMGQRNYHEVTGDNVNPSMIRGVDFIRDPRLNKGMAFTLEERQALGIHGLLPPRFKTQEEQVRLCRENVERYQNDLNKYIYLVGLQDRNERLFYRLIAENVEQMMHLIYTPTVGLACQKFGLIYRRPRGLFITIHDKGHVYQVLRNWPEPDVRAIVVTDGERILGLGDLGAYGMGIPVGKLTLYTALAGIKPTQCLPILLDVGTNTKSLLEDPYYIGLRHKRVTGREYDEFMDEFMEAVVRRYGQNTLIQFVDFANHNSFRLLAKYRDRYCAFNDDIQGTAAVFVAGILASLRITKNKLKDHRFLFLGAGEGVVGIAMLLIEAMVKTDGITADDAASRMFLSDMKGLLVKSRAKDISAEKQVFLHDLPHLTNFAEMIEAVKPTALLGATATKGAFNTAIIKRMAELNERPLIFALSNPASKAECTAAEAYEESDGRAIFASGSPFPNYEYKGKTYSTGQGNNAYIFPGVSLAVMASGIRHINDDVFLLSAQALADIVTQKDLDAGRLYPPLTQIQNVSVFIAKTIMEDAYEKGTATTYPEPAKKEEFIKAQLYNHNYSKALPDMYTWPSV